MAAAVPAPVVLHVLLAENNDQREVRHYRRGEGKQGEFFTNFIGRTFCGGCFIVPLVFGDSLRGSLLMRLREATIQPTNFLVVD